MITEFTLVVCGFEISLNQSPSTQVHVSKSKEKLGKLVANEVIIQKTESINTL